MTLEKKIEGLDLTTVMKRVSTKKGMEGKMLSKAEALYKQYLYLRAKYPNKTIVPPKLADEVWHEHIMASQQYVSDCESIFGGYLHHNESDDTEFLNKGWENTQHLYKQEFALDILKAGHMAAGCS